MNDNQIIIEVKVLLEGRGELFYRLLKCFDGENGDMYSLYVILNPGDSEETAFLEDISRDRDEAVDYLFLFAKETVTPDTAVIIMEELLSV